MSRLWEALTPASGSAAPWTHLAPPPSSEEDLESPADIPWPPHEAIGSPPMRQDLPRGNDPEETDPCEPQEPLNVASLLQNSTEKELDDSIWKETGEGSAYVEIGPENEFLVSKGVSVPPFRAHFNLLTAGSDPVREVPSLDTIQPPLPSLAKPETTASVAVSPIPSGSIAAPVIRGILERLTHHAKGDQAPWLFLSPGTGHGGLTPKGLKAAMENVIDSIARQHGPVACLEMDDPMDGGLHAPRPGWQDLLWGRVELENILVAGRNPLVTRIPRGDDFHPEGTWFATRSIHGVATEIRKHFGMVVVASLSPHPDAIARFWLAQCQGWTWVTSVRSWETTPLEAEARLHSKGLPPWIGCVLVEGVAAAA